MLENACRTLHRLPLGLPVVLSFWIGLTLPAHANLTPQLSLDDLARAADAIVIATATHTESLWVGRDLLTRVTLDVESTLLGGLSGPIHVIVPGGIAPDRRIPVALVVPGQPRIRTGERSLLFLRSLQPDSADFGLVGDAQGRFVLLPLSGNSLVATRDLSAVHLVDETGVSRGDTTAVPLEILIERIRTLLETDTR